jgi:plasmid stability protein
MTIQAITLNLPETLYDRLKQRAEQTHRSIEDELLETVATAIPLTEELPDDLNEAISHLHLLDDQALWRAARSHLSTDVAAEMEQLHLKRQREGLTENETQTLNSLLHQYERTMLVRAQAAALLKQRGHDVSELVTNE